MNVGDRLDARLIELGNAQRQTNSLLLHQTQQLFAINCGVQGIARATCDLVNYAAIESSLMTRLADHGRVTAELARTVYPDAALELARRDAAQAEVKRCCPDQPVGPPCQHERCPDPGLFRPREVATHEASPIG